MADSKIKFIPICATSSTLNSIAYAEGQYIVVTDVSELYLDMGGQRTRVSTKVTIGLEADEPSSPSTGDLWFVVEEETEE